MPKFVVKLASEEKVWTEECWASDGDEVRRIYEKKGIVVLKVRRKFTLSRSKLKWRDRIIFTQQFLALVKAGVPFVRIFEIISSRLKNPRMLEILSGAKERVIDGAELSEAFKPYTKDLGVLFITALAAGERSGKIAYTLEKYLDYANFMESTTSKIKSSLTYPTVVITVSFFLVFLLTTFVIPRFASFYKTAQLQLPALTLFILSLSSFMKAHWLYIVLGLILLYVAYRNSFRIKPLYMWVEKAKLVMPFLGEGIFLISSSLYLRTLSFLLDGGIPVVQAALTAAEASPNGYLREKLRQVPEKVSQGFNLSQALEESGAVEELGIEMVRVGEGSGQLSDLLFQGADYLEKEFEFKVRRYLGIIEPLTILFLGVVVGIMLLSVYLPIFELARGVR